MRENILLIDSDYDEASGFIKGLEEITNQEWVVGLHENNKNYGIKRYIKFFTVALHTVLNRKKYREKKILCWQQFYGIAIAFFCRLFHVKKDFNLIIMTFIYKQKKGIAGKIFYKFVKYAVTSKYVDKIILTSRGEIELYSKLFGLPREIFDFAKTGAIEYDPEQYYNEKLQKEDYLFSTGRSNRDYDFLIKSLQNTKRKLIIACDCIGKCEADNITIYNNVFGEKMLEYMRNAKAVAIALDDDKIAAGQLVLLHAMNMGVPVIITKSKGVTDDYVIDGYNGIIIEKTTEALLETLDKIEKDKELYMKLKINSLKEFKDNYTYYAMGKKVGKILNEI